MNFPQDGHIHHKRKKLSGFPEVDSGLGPGSHLSIGGIWRLLLTDYAGHCGHCGPGKPFDLPLAVLSQGEPHARGDEAAVSHPQQRAGKCESQHETLQLQSLNH